MQLVAVSHSAIAWLMLCETRWLRVLHCCAGMSHLLLVSAQVSISSLAHNSFTLTLRLQSCTIISLIIRQAYLSLHREFPVRPCFCLPDRYLEFGACILSLRSSSHLQAQFYSMLSFFLVYVLSSRLKCVFVAYSSRLFAFPHPPLPLVLVFYFLYFSFTSSQFPFFSLYCLRVLSSCTFSAALASAEFNF